MGPDIGFLFIFLSKTESMVLHLKHLALAFWGFYKTAMKLLPLLPWKMTECPFNFFSILWLLNFQHLNI
jgi:hypothetical protein